MEVAITLNASCMDIVYNTEEKIARLKYDCERDISFVALQKECIRVYYSHYSVPL